jgi:hypothetical protein
VSEQHISLQPAAAARPAAQAGGMRLPLLTRLTHILAPSFRGQQNFLKLRPAFSNTLDNETGGRAADWKILQTATTGPRVGSQSDPAHDINWRGRSLLRRTHIERLNGKIKRRTDVVGIFPNEDAIVRLVAAIRLEQNDGWAAPRARYITLESIASHGDDTLVGLPNVAA